MRHLTSGLFARASVVILLSLFTTFNINSQWSEQSVEIIGGLRSISAANDSVVWTCGIFGRVLKTTNSGYNWLETTSPNPSLILFNIWAVNESVALVAGNLSDTYVYKTTDGGESWLLVFAQQNGFVDNIVQYSFNNNELFMQGDPVGGRWSLWKSSDMGSSWDSTGSYLSQLGSEVGFNNSIYITYNSSSYTLWFGTDDTLIHHYSNSVWTTQYCTGVRLVLSIWFNDMQRGMVGGNGGGTMAFTSNGGNVWTQMIPIPGSGGIIGIAGEGEHWWYARSDKIYYSSNNGVNWTRQFTLGRWFFNHLTKARTGTRMWAVSEDGAIVKYYGTIGIEPVSNLVPKEFFLYQNYPNPFNPTTKIKFGITKSTETKLVIFDITGREVVTLVNELVNPGVYEVSWDGSNYSSGIYFYKLLANEYTSVKKMSLIK